MRLLKFLIILLFQLNFLHAQEFNIISPMNIPLYISGNFGELRGNHFHTGIDIKTQSVEGIKVFTVENGYISRIKVGKGGYGHALYITHQNGYTSVYGHLQSFVKPLHDYVRSVQYKQKKFEVDLYLEPDQFKFSKGDVIAYSGNSGGSSGPHLHFEIRDASQRPLNALAFGLPIQDNLPPVFRRIITYDLTVDCQPKNRYEVVKNNEGNYEIKDGVTVYVASEAGFGVEVYDYLNGARNRCGVYALQCYDNGNILFDMHIDQLNFSTNRYINSHIDYHEKVVNRKNIHKLFLLPNNKLNIYKKATKGGIDFSDGNPHNIVIKAIDRQGNNTQLSFTAQKTNKNPACDLDFDEVPNHFKHDRENVFAQDGFIVKVPALALYNDISFKFLKEDSKWGYSDIYHIHDKATPLHKSMSISIPLIDVKNSLQSKLFIAKLGNKPSDFESIGGAYKNGSMVATTRGFGRFTVSSDTVKPIIKSVSLGESRNMTGKKRLAFIIKDEHTGLSSYTGTIDGIWVLFQYDAKNDLIYYEFKDQKISSGKVHKVFIEAVDRVNNKAYFEAEFEW